MTGLAKVAAFIPLSPWRRGLIFGPIVVAGAVLALTVVTGFRGIEVSNEGETIVYRSSIWWTAAFLLGGLAMATTGVAIVTLPNWLFRLMGCIGLVCGLMVAVIAPTPLAQSLVITSQGFDDTIGFWWEPKTTSVRFDSLASMTILSYRDETGQPAVRLECVHKDGQRVTIHGSDKLKAGLAHIALRATIRNVPVSIRDEEDHP